MMFSGYTNKFYGEYLYKYYSYKEDTTDMFAPVINNSLKYTLPSEFNDPYDCYIAMSQRNIVNSVQKQEMEHVHVCSFTSSVDNILMWSHYASNHKGFVIEYKTEKLREIQESQIEDFSYVEYSNTIPLRNFFSNKGEADIVKAIFHKSSCWRYENEVRSAFYGDSETNQKYKLIELPKNTINSIILGSQFCTETKGKIPIILKPWFEAGKLYYMQMLSDTYKLERKNDIKTECFLKD